MGQYAHLEFELLRYLAERAGRIVHRDALHRAVWGYAEVSLTRSVDNAIVRLRRKLETDPARPRLIHTARGDGYVLACDAGGRESQPAPKSGWKREQRATVQRRFNPEDR